VIYNNDQQNNLSQETEYFGSEWRGEDSQNNKHKFVEMIYNKMPRVVFASFEKI
jgi:hypothetical protein